MSGSTIKSSQCLFNERTLCTYISGLVSGIDHIITQCSLNRLSSKWTGSFSSNLLVSFRLPTTNKPGADLALLSAVYKALRGIVILYGLLHNRKYHLDSYEL